MAETVIYIILTIKNSFILPLFCTILGIRKPKKYNCDGGAEYLGENIPFSIMDKITKRV